MARKKTVNKTEEPKGVAEAEKTARVKEAEEGRAAVVKKLLRKLEEQMGGGEVKASLGDYIRLVQLHKELDEEAPREIKVTWVEPAENTLVNDAGNQESGSEE